MRYVCRHCGTAGHRKASCPDLVLERFRALYVERPDSGCWFWIGNANALGYGLVWDQKTKRLVRAHRRSYELHVGPIPAGMVLDHYRMNEGPRHAHCSTSCVNPAHLEVVTPEENFRRGRLRAICDERKSRTHCPAGHEYSPENTRVRRNRRECKRCKRERENGSRAIKGRTDSGAGRVRRRAYERSVQP